MEKDVANGLPALAEASTSIMAAEVVRWCPLRMWTLCCPDRCRRWRRYRTSSQACSAMKRISPSSPLNTMNSGSTRSTASWSQRSNSAVRHRPWNGSARAANQPDPAPIGSGHQGLATASQQRGMDFSRDRANRRPQLSGFYKHLGGQNGGGTGIRTLGASSPGTTVFETASSDRTGTASTNVQGRADTQPLASNSSSRPTMPQGDRGPGDGEPAKGSQAAADHWAASYPIGYPESILTSSDQSRHRLTY